MSINAHAFTQHVVVKGRDAVSSFTLANSAASPDHVTGPETRVRATAAAEQRTAVDHFLPGVGTMLPRRLLERRPMLAPAGGFTESLLNCFEPRLAVRDSSPLLDERLPFLGLLGFNFAASNT